ncbi:MAG: LPXTG cell wall anchor domain-containing protein [bacterium]|nr:LPXTG cell wall anchor domain-containing protein [bacterium]
MDKKSLLSSQIIIILYLLTAAISCIELMAQFPKGGFSNPWIYVLGLTLIGSVVMYFIKKKQRFENK